MTEKEFDAFFKTRLEKAEADVPADMWERISRKKKKRRIFFIPRWYLFGVLLLMIMAAGGYLYFNPQNNTQAEAALKKKTHRDGVNKILPGQSVAPSIESQLDNYAVDSLKQNGSKEDNDKKSGHSSESFPPNNYSAAAKKRQYTDLLRPQKNENEKALPVAKPGEQLSQLNDTGNLYSPSMVVLDTSKTIVMDSAALEKKSTTRNNGVDSSGEREMESQKAARFSVDVFLSPDLPFNSFNSSDPSYEQLLNQAKMRFSWSAGARLNIEINKKLMARTGFQYAVVNQQFSIIDTVLVKAGEPSKFTSLDIPVVFGYKIGDGRIKKMINAGILLNISSRYSGVIPSPGGSFLQIDSTNVYNKNTGISLFLSTSLSKQISNRFDVFAEPYFKYRVKSMTNSFQLFDHKIHTLGILIGVQYKLFKK